MSKKYAVKATVRFDRFVLVEVDDQVSTEEIFRRAKKALDKRIGEQGISPNHISFVLDEIVEE